MPLTIVMYHYVRPIAGSRYPNVKGLELDLFVEQVKYIKRHYEPVTAEQVIAAAKHGEKLPTNAIWLTFDDGYVDHYAHVMPVLLRENIQGAFFPPARCVQERVVLDVNKIHFVLAKTEDVAALVARVDALVDEARGEYALDSLAAYHAKHEKPNRFDTGEVIYVKRMLQVELPDALRARIADRLFAEIVSADEADFASELYLSTDQVKEMIARGMMIGSHGYAHVWLNKIDAPAQEEEISRSLEFLGAVGAPVEDWIMCYPYNGWNESLLDIVKRKRCALGVAGAVSLVDFQRDNPLVLPRLDTNDLPKSALAPPNAWTLEALAGGPAS